MADSEENGSYAAQLQKEWGDHAAWSELQNARKGAIQVLEEEADSLPRGQLERILQVLLAVESHLDAGDPILAHMGHMHNVEKQLRGCKDSLHNYRDQNQPNHLQSAENHASAALKEAYLLVRVAVPAEAEGLPSGLLEAAARLEERSQAQEKALAALQSSTGKLEKRLDSLEDVRSQLNQQMGETKESIAQALQDAKEQMEGLANQAAEEFDERFNDLKDRLETRSDEHIDAVGTKMQAEVDRFKEKNDKTQEAHSAQAKKTLSELRTVKEEAQEVIGAIGATGMTAGFQESAEVASKKATRWRVGAVICWSLLAAYVVLVIAVLPLWASSSILFSNVWSAQIAKVLGAGAFAALGSYVSHQAGHFRDIEREDRKRALVLASIGPYLANMEPNEKNTVKKEVLDHVFGLVEEGGNKDDK